jgi:hypothetical protein
MSMQGVRPTYRLVSAVAAALLAMGAVSACDADSDGDDYEAVCVDHSGTRVDDSRCDSAPQNYARDDSISADPFLWYYLGTMNNGGYAAAVGQRVSGGTYRTPVIVKTGSAATSGSGSTAKAPTISRGGSVPSTGGSISRGGFGIKSGGASTGGGGKAGGSGSTGGGAKGGSAGS